MMKKILCVTIFAASLVTASGQLTFHSFLDSIHKISEPADKLVLIDAFLQQVDEMGYPFIEGDTANFIYYGTADSVYLTGDFDGWQGSMKCDSVPGTDFFFFSLVFPPDARVDYKFIINGSSWILDPRNPNRVSGGFGPNSELAMPAYVQPWEIEEYEGVAKGTIESFTLKSPQFGRTFSIKVYLPPGYEEASAHAYPTVYVHDGQEYISLGNMDIVMENLLDSNKIDPVIGVFIRPVNRSDEYAYANRFNYADYIVETVVPYVDSAYKTYPHADYRLTMGASFGGNISGLISHTYPDIIANSGWHSPMFWPNDGEVANMFFEEKKDVKIYYTAGVYEYPPEVLEFLDDGFDSNGYEFEWVLYNEGHSWGHWRATIDNILTYFFPAGSTPVSVEDAPAWTASRSLQNYPNPASDLTYIPVVVSAPDSYTLSIYDHLGKLVEQQAFRYESAGDYKIKWAVSTYKPGLYHYVLKGGKSTSSGTMVVGR